MKLDLFNYILIREITIKNELAGSKIDYTGTWLQKGRLFALESIPQTNLSDIVKFLINEFNKKDSFTSDNKDYKYGYFSELHEIQNYIVSNSKQINKK